MRIIFRKSTGKSFLNILKAQQRSFVYKSTTVYADYVAMSMGKLDKKQHSPITGKKNKQRLLVNTNRKLLQILVCSKDFFLFF